MRARLVWALLSILPVMPVNATAFDRRMRGGAQAHLLRADDGHWYVTKFVENPQHRRILINEWLAAIFLEYLQVSCPKVAVINLSHEFLERQRDSIYIQLGSQRREIQPGWHFGSRHPGDPNQLAVYDYLPDTLLDQTYNLRDFLGVLVFDKWTGNADARQAIFFRSRVRDWLDAPEAAAQKKGFVAQMVDHGYVFGGPDWSFTDGPLEGLYYRHTVYRTVTGFGELDPWLARVESVPESVFDQALRSTPREWLNGEEDALERLLETLHRRRTRVRQLIEDCANCRQSPFPSWNAGR